MKTDNAFDIINERRKSAHDKAEAVRKAALVDAEYARIDKAMLDLDIEIARKLTLNENVFALECEYNKLDKLRLSALKRLNLSENSFTPIFACKKCNDTGFSNGKYCTCAVNLIYNELTKNSGNSLVKAHFSDFDPSLYPEGKQREDITLFYKRLKEFCKKFPYTKVKNILVMGATGVGKTQSISSVAHELTANGYSVLYLTAFSVNNIMREMHTDFSKERNIALDEVLSADLLIIDDLGTEPVFKNVTENYFFLIINERMLKGLHTIISTNLDFSAINDRYGTRIASRLTDKDVSLTVRLEGADIRRRGR